MHKGNGEKQTLTMHFFSRLVCWKSQALGIAYLDFAPLFTLSPPTHATHFPTALQSFFDAVMRENRRNMRNI